MRQEETDGGTTEILRIGREDATFFAFDAHDETTQQPPQFLLEGIGPCGWGC